MRVERKMPDAAKLQACTFDSDAGMVYHTIEYSKFLSLAVGGEERILTAWSGELLEGYLRYFRINVPLYGVVYNSSPWFGSHGGCVVRNNARGVRHKLLEALKEDIENEKRLLSVAISLSPREYKFKHVYLQNLQHAIFEPRVAQIISLPETDIDIEKQILLIAKSKSRNLIRKSLQQKFVYSEVQTDSAWDFLLATHKENMHAIGGKPKEAKHFSALRHELGPLCKLCTAYYNDEAVAAMLLLNYGRWVEYFIPVIKQEFRPMQPLSFLIFRSICIATKEKRRYWNFGGTRSNQRSLHHFKAGWGAEDYPYGYIIHITQLGREIFSQDSSSVMKAFDGYYIFPRNLMEEQIEA